MGRDSTGAKNHMDGQPVRVLAYRIPERSRCATAGRWRCSIESLHVIHNFLADPGSDAARAWTC